jgi:2'-hydroxyisoflavone reductase
MADRREFVRVSATAALGLSVPGVSWAKGAARERASPVPRLDGVERAGRSLRILILGGTGFTGPHQVAYALARGHRLTLFNRGRREVEWPGAVEELTGDRNEPGGLRALEGREWDVCIDNPTTLPFWVRDAGQVLQGRVGQYIFISTLSVYASNAEADADETAATAPYDGDDPLKETLETLQGRMGQLYGPLKAASERESEKWFPGRTTVIRPGLIVGPRDNTDRFTYWPVRIDRGGEVLAPGDGTDAAQIIDARDLAEWTIRMAEQRTMGTFNATGPGSPMTMAEMLYGIRAVTTSAVRFTWVPAEFLAEQQVRPWSDMPVWMSGPTMRGFARRSVRRAMDNGLTFRPLATTAADTLAWWKTLPIDRQANPLSGIRPDREAEVLRAWRVRG